MIKQRRINVLAALVIAAGGLILSAPQSAKASSFDGCSDAQALINRRSEACAAMGGEFSFSGWCNATEYSVTTSCTYLLPNIPG